jgi:hypothetical protein
LVNCSDDAGDGYPLSIGFTTIRNDQKEMVMPAKQDGGSAEPTEQTKHLASCGREGCTRLSPRLNPLQLRWDLTNLTRSITSLAQTPNALD